MISEVLGIIYLVCVIVGVCAVLPFIFSCWGHDNDAGDDDNVVTLLAEYIHRVYMYLVHLKTMELLWTCVVI